MSVIPGAWRRTAAGAGLLDADGTVAPTIFAEMSAAAVRTGAINLGQGFPDEDGPEAVLDAARAAIADGVNQYPPGRGFPDLLTAIAEHQRRFYGLEVDPGTEVIVTAGATEALTATLLALIDGSEDEVVVFEPYYDSYAAAVALAGARLRTVPLRAPGFQPDLDQLAEAVTDRTRIILVNDPHNPTGAVFDEEVRREVVRLAARHDAVIVTDEVYEHLTFDAPHVPIATLPGAAERTLTISSAGKTFSTTGWKIGWVHGPAALITAVLTVKQYLTYVNGAPFQPAVAVGLRLDDAFFTDAAAVLARKHAILGDGLRAAGFTVHAPQGGYFTVADATALGGADAAGFCRTLPDRAGVVAIPLTAFVSPAQRSAYAGLVRFAACKRIDVLEEAAARLAGLNP
ncbi:MULTISPECIES: aminotransferase class I/II-fold pyridoxal phosphate-dependent enzyme [Microbacterium]|uniref:aminotransferase class I/II-fold pyridoxal phosphate-dependent enzyme n=1 Tax=Microbacterium TaxID=33882 RepID=UPI0004697E4C|nr:MULTISPECIES: aminotransferase class I/II-fold pyridoxal phosphate-dependent enzyme [Microbacterium]AMG85126.1 aminotransferase [Microbacterium sp. PAMC 28756]QXE30987.1 aminotransferase class I/II-fold pyridoxal phosphate-dependent enzyme [Microbacterium paraoxydans]